MPYIKREDKIKFKSILEELPKMALGNPGELNYIITKFCVQFLENKGESYATINEIIGVLECAKQEFYRRIAVPLEIRKQSENGDVYVHYKD